MSGDRAVFIAAFWGIAFLVGMWAGETQSKYQCTTQQVRTK